ncbi:hypothetical protein AVEN_120172-1 [Araneus ventricosus]|uniref:Tc1-like transposase DDE domain-containing protein n=1 Tax=Araneus ventricosus TaxID=182803 RepID=A0A4Y2GP58_ARAVE|nr:hypothetical protein AVEN_120172-1 [Araneus ventricosus]
MDAAIAHSKSKMLCQKCLKILFHRNNVPAHTSAASFVNTKLHDLRYQVLLLPSYSPDLAPSDKYMSPNMRKCLLKKIFIERSGDCRNNCLL